MNKNYIKPLYRFKNLYSYAKTKERIGELISSTSLEQLSALTTERIITWLARLSEQRISMYRFIDVYPALNTDSMLEQYINEYLSIGTITNLQDSLLRRSINKHNHFSLSTYLKTSIVKYFMDKLLEVTSILTDTEEIASYAYNYLSNGTRLYIDVLGYPAYSSTDSARYITNILNILDLLKSIYNNHIPPEEDRAQLGSFYPLGYTNQSSSIFAISLRPNCMSPHLHPLRIDRGLVDVTEHLLNIADRAKTFDVALIINSENSEECSQTIPWLTRAAERPAYKELKLGVAVQADWPNIHDILDELLTISRTRISKGYSPLIVRLNQKLHLDIRKNVLDLHGWPNPNPSNDQVEKNFTYCLEFLDVHRDELYPAIAAINHGQVEQVLQATKSFSKSDFSFELHVTPLLKAKLSTKAQVSGTISSPVDDQIIERIYLPISDASSLSLHVIEALDSMLAVSSVVPTSRSHHLLPNMHRLLDEDQYFDPSRILTPPVARRTPSRATDKPRRPWNSPSFDWRKPPKEEERREERKNKYSNPTDTSNPRIGVTHLEHSSSFALEPAAEWHHPELSTSFSHLISQILLRYPMEIGAVIAGHTRWGNDSVEAFNPADPDRLLFQATCCETSEVELAVRSAVDSFVPWTETPLGKRAEIALLTAEWLRHHRWELAATEVVETGKTWIEADADVCGAIDFCEYHARAVLHAPRTTSTSQGSTHLSREINPRGICVALPPWGSPLAKAADVIMKGLMGGNTLILVPSSVQVINLLHMMTEALLNAGLPEGTISLLPGLPPRLLGQVSTHPEIGFIISNDLDLPQDINGYYNKVDRVKDGLPGVVSHGAISPSAGNNTVIVDEDADLNLAVSVILTSAFSYAGQYEHSISKLIVVDKLEESLLSRIESSLSSLIIGEPTNRETQLGPVLDASSFTRLNAFIDNASAMGKLLFRRGDLPERGYYVTPALISVPHTNGHRNSVDPLDNDIERDRTSYGDDLFDGGKPRGPILLVETVKDFGSAVRLANHNGWAFADGIVSRNPSNIRKAVHVLRANCISINKPTTDLRAESTYLPHLAATGLQDEQASGYFARYTATRLISESTGIGDLLLPEAARFYRT